MPFNILCLFICLVLLNFLNTFEWNRIELNFFDQVYTDAPAGGQSYAFISVEGIQIERI